MLVDVAYTRRDAGELLVGRWAGARPVVSRSLLGLEASGLVESNPVGADRRVRGIRLSRKERDLVQPAKSAERAVWPVIEAAVAHACKPLKGSLLEQLAALGAALERISLQKRAADAEAATSTPARRRRAR